MYNSNVNADMLNGTFDAAQLENDAIVVANGTITVYHRTLVGYETKWLSFEAGNANTFNEVVKILHDAANGIDLFVDGVFVGYFKWTNNFENGYVGWKLFTDEGTKIAENACGMKRYSENSRNLVAASMYDYIKENFRDPVDVAFNHWADKTASPYGGTSPAETMTYNTENGYLNVWVDAYFFQMDEKLTGDWDTDYRNASDFFENLSYNLGGALEGTSVETDECWDDAVLRAVNLSTLSDVWGLDFDVETFLGEWLDENLRHIVSDDCRGFFEPAPFRISVCLDGKSAKYDYPVDDFRFDFVRYLYDIVHDVLDDKTAFGYDMNEDTDEVVNLMWRKWDKQYEWFLPNGYHYDEDDECVFYDEYEEPTDEEKRRAAEIADYCRNYGYDWLTEYDVDFFDTLNDDDFTLLPMLGECPDSFYDEFGEDADWDYDAMYEGFADALYELTGKKWRVECDGYRVYGYLTDTDPAETLDAMRKQHGAAAGRLIADAISA